MSVLLNHTIVPANDKWEGASFIASILGLGPPRAYGPFVCVETENEVSLDYDDRRDVTPHHYAFLISEDEFDAVFERVQERGLTYWADPGHQRPGQLSGHGRGFYFDDPSGHNMEVLTRTYGT